MARKIKTEKSKKKTFVKVVVTILVLALIGAGVFFGWKHFHKSNKSVQSNEVVDEIKEFEYSIRERDSKYFKSEYEELKKILFSEPVDEEKYATQLAKMFVIDLYTMDTKVNKYDIGGIQFIHPDKKEIFSQKLIDTMYQSMLDDTYGDRKQNLPEVKEISVVSTEKTDYKLGDDTVDAYLVKMNITYVKDYKYDTQASVIVVKQDEKKLCVVDIQPTLNPKY